MSNNSGSSTALSRGARAQAVADALAEAKAWRVVAERMSRPPLHFLSTHLALLAGSYSSFIWVQDPSAVPVIDRAMYHRMVRRISAHAQMPGARLPSERGFRSTRILAALFVALECESESRSLRCQEGKV